MAVAVRSNGLHHAVSLGAIEVASKGCSKNNYDSEDDSGRRRLRHTSSTELYPRASVYSKGDIREQYCLTDRQLNSIERPRRDGFFGCLSRRSTRSQSFLGVCVGRRAPSDENLAYAPFHKYPRYQYKRDDSSPDTDRDVSYFRRQPASILSTGRLTSDHSTMNDPPLRQSWPTQANKGVKIATDGMRTYCWFTPIEGFNQTGLLENCFEVRCMALTSCQQKSFQNQNEPKLLCAHTCNRGTNVGGPQIGFAHAGTEMHPATPRTKHVSFARSHTLTSFNDTNIGFNSLDRLKTAQSQERLIGGKKACFPMAQTYEQTMQPHPLDATAASFAIHHQHPTAVVQTAPHIHAFHGNQAGHSHAHRHLPVHIHQFVPSYNPDFIGQVPTEQQIPLPVGVIACAAPPLPPPSPEILIVEKKFRNAMKTQATQTDVRKQIAAAGLELSPRSIQKITVVSQGAQTNGIRNKCSKTSDETFNFKGVPTIHKQHVEQQIQTIGDNFYYQPEAFISTRPLQSQTDPQNNIEYYERPTAPLSFYRRSSCPNNEEREPESVINQQGAKIQIYKEGLKEYEYESHSLPRRTCSHQHQTNEFMSHSLPRYSTDMSGSYLDAQAADFMTHLLPPPSQYCKNDNDDQYMNEEAQPQSVVPSRIQEEHRRKSLIPAALEETEMDSPFRRDDIRRQSMPIYMKHERLIDGYAPRSSFRTRDKSRSKLFQDVSDEKEILIDFKPHMSPKPGPKLYQRHRKAQRVLSDVGGMTLTNFDNRVYKNKSQLWSNDQLDDEQDSKSLSDSQHQSSEEYDDNAEDHLYENIPSNCTCAVPESKREQFRKRSVSLDDAEYVNNKVTDVLSPPSPCLNVLADASTYPSSDSLANDLTRDHSDGIWNESQATVLTAEQRDATDNSFLNSNTLLTPSSKRKSLLLQHQQRSSVDTDALDFEDQMDNSPIYSNMCMTKAIQSTEQPSSQQVLVKNRGAAIAITPGQPVLPEITLSQPMQSGTSPVQPKRKIDPRNIEKYRTHMGRTDPLHKINANTDISECSTNTDDYITCTDTSKRTPGIKTPPTATSSSSTTQVPVSTQSSQMDKSHGSSFESASSLHSSRGDILTEDLLQHDECLAAGKTFNDMMQKTELFTTQSTKISPSHSLSSTSSGSYKAAGISSATFLPTYDESKKVGAEGHLTNESCVGAHKEKLKPKQESVSDDERSELRYSSSGYYESPPHDDIEQTKIRRHRYDEERKRRKTSMKLDIEKENMRALTSPIKRSTAAATAATCTTTKTTSTTMEKSPDQSIENVNNAVDAVSPNKVKRLRPKVRRQFRRSSRDESATQRRQKPGGIYGNLPPTGNTEKLLDCSIKTPPACSPAKITEKCNPNIVGTSAATIKSASIGCTVAEPSRLKAKSTESLRSVSPGSDSVFYSEADGIAGDQHCQHCGKGIDGEPLPINMLGGDSVESIPFIENDEDRTTEQDIVRPPSDFADSPVTTKTTQRLYKKMDRRFRSEERGRHYKTRQENIRAKSEERNREQSTRSPLALRPSGSSPCVLPEASFEQNQQIIYRGHYDVGRYARLTDADVWAQLDHQCFDRQRERRDSTESERSFHSKYQVILHRLVQRRCTLEMYHRQKNNKFCVDKTVVVKSDSGEFGFRIHGSKPVVVAAIEPDTPAESSGLEVGDIIISVNGIQVLDKHHTEVVKIAHDGCEKLELKVARTIGVLMSEQHEPPYELVYSGYLWRQGGQAKGLPNSKKWVRRWFCLRSDNCLYYYKTEGSTQPVGAMIMAKHKVEYCPSDVGKPYAFKVDSGEGVPLFVASDSEELTNYWMKILKQAAAQNNPWLETCARYLYQQPSTVDRPDCFGYLLKLGSRWCGWSKRYCVLKDACLYFYQDAGSKAAFGMACLHGYKVATMSTNTSGKKNSFEIIPPEPKLRHYYFCAESEMDKKRWISALEYSIDRWIKSG